MLDLKGIARIFEEIELRLVASLKRNLLRHRQEESREGFDWSAWQAEKLRSVQAFHRENRRLMDEYVDIIDDSTRQLMGEQFIEGERLAEQRVREAVPETLEVPPSELTVGTEPQFFGVNAPKMERLIEDITTIEQKAETSALRMTDDIYRQTVNRVQLAMATGSMTLPQAVDIATRDFLDKGINSIVYSDGKRVHIADYVRMALRTTATRATLQGQAKRFAELGYDTVMTTQYAACSKTCEPWQGRVYIDNVFVEWRGEVQIMNGIRHGRSNYCGKWFPLLSEAIGEGLFHPNCRHTLVQYIDGVTRIPDPIPADVVKRNRELEQRQRKMERNIRRLKRYSEGTCDPDSAKAYRRELREEQKRLREFIAEHEEVLRRDPSREKSSAAELTEEEKNELNKPYTDVTQEYLDNATPGEGDFTIDEGCEGKHYKKEVDFADWLHNTLGGSIHVNEEKHEYEGQKNPDYLWNEKLWDLKSPKNEEGANSLIRKGLRQIVENPGGIMLDYEDKSISLDKLQRIIDKRMEWVRDKTVDIMIVRNGKIIKILRYKK